MTPQLRRELENLTRDDKIEVIRLLREQVDFDDFQETFREAVEKRFARPLGTIGVRACPHCGGPL